jgi:hypothetical protein
MNPMKDMKNSKKKELHVLHALHGEHALLWWAVALCFALGALLGWREIGSPDIGFHLSSARWMLEHRAWPMTDSFTFTVTGHPYIDMQWLFQLVLYGANRAGGVGLIVAVKTLVTLVFWGLLVLRARRAAGALPWSVPLLLLLVALGDYFEERPHIFSWVYGSLILLILEEFARGNRRWLPALPVIMLFWVNTHQLFVLGLVLIGVHTGWELRKGTAADRRLLLFALLSVAACFANPYHLRGVLFPLTLFGEIQSGHVFAAASSGITELQPPFSTALYFLAGRFVLFQPPLYWHLYTVLSLVGLAGAWRKTRAPDLVIWALFAYVFSMAHKNFGYFVMATFPLAAAGVDRALSWTRAIAARRGDRRPSSARLGEPRALLWIPIALVAVLAPLTLSGKLYQLGWGDVRIRAGYSSRFLPVEASEFLRDHQIEGNVLTTFANGAYVHWVTRLRVSIYSLEEVLGPAFYDEYVASLGPQGFAAFLNRYRPTVVVASIVEAPYWVYHLSAQPAWRLVQFNDSFVVFLHESVAGPPALAASRPGVDYAMHTRDDMKRIIADASDRPDMTLRAWFQGNEALQQSRIRLSSVYMYTGRLDACVSTGIDGLAASPIRVMEQLLVLGNAFNALGDYELSDLCFSGALKSRHADAQTRQQVQTVVASRARR